MTRASADYLRTWTTLLRDPRGTPRDVRAFQDRRVRELVAHAYERVPFYRALYREHGVKPADVRGVADLCRLPVVEKRTLQSLAERDVLARGVDPARLVVRRTSGSSGRPFSIRRTWLEERTLGLLRLRAMHAIGYRPSDRSAVTVLKRPLQRNDVQVPMRLLNALGLLRSDKLDCLEAPERIAGRLRELAPDVVLGFPGVLSKIGPVAAEGSAGGWRPRLVIVGGEVMTPLMRRRIEEGFAAPVFDVYGAHEFNLLGWQCAASGDLHTCDDGLVLEVLRDGRPVAPGERGEVVATNLHAFAMPFLRYRLGDVVTRLADPASGAAACACGLPFASIGAVQGRMIDYFPLPGGRLLHPFEIVRDLLGVALPLAEYQILQERVDRVVVRIVPARAPAPAELAALRDAVQRHLGPTVELDVRVVDRIPLEATGKFRVVRSLVHSNYDGVAWENAARTELRASA